MLTQLNCLTNCFQKSFDFRNLKKKMNRYIVKTFEAELKQERESVNEWDRTSRERERETLYTVPNEINSPWYNMKCSGENVILRGIFHVVSRFPLHFMLYRGNFDCFSNSAETNNVKDERHKSRKLNDQIRDRSYKTEWENINWGNIQRLRAWKLKSTEKKVTQMGAWYRRSESAVDILI